MNAARGSTLSAATGASREWCVTGACLDACMARGRVILGADMVLPSSRDLRSRAHSEARLISDLAAKGIPAVRAALHGARVGAGAAFSPAVVERLGIAVLPVTTRRLGEAIAAATGGTGLVLQRGGATVRAGAREFVLHAKDGLMLRVASKGGVDVAVSRDAVRAIARTSTRGALLGAGRAVLGGAVAGAVLDGAIAGAWALRAVYLGESDARHAARFVAKRAVRGALAGSLGVAAAGIVSAGIAATGISLVGAPVVVPLATMIAAGAAATRVFDRVFGA